MSDLDEPVTARQVDAIAQKLDDVIAAVNRETEARLKEAEAMRLKHFTARRAMRRSWVALAVAVLAVAAGLIVQGYETNQRDDDRTDAAVVSCINSNESRQSIEDRFEQLIAQLGNFNPPADEDARVARQQTIDKFTVDFRATMPAALQPRDCSPKAATQPTLVTR